MLEIQIRHVHQGFPTPQGEWVVFKDLNLEIPPGSFTVIVGPSGCGKSTLLRIVAGLLRPTAGQVRLGTFSPEEARAARWIGWMGQGPALLPWRTVEGNIRLALEVNGRSLRPALAIQELIGLVGLSGFERAYPHMLSGGMQQRVALARTLAPGPRVWLMDEPFAALDALTREQLLEEVERLWQRFRATVLWVTHDLYEAARLADEVVVLAGRPARIRARFPIPDPRPRQDERRIGEWAQRIRQALAGGTR
ncbi:ABC transporter ATP-binding protein [Thermoflexus sp.]|uniref:ABC transporter ATP-binding protein n=1 Tax=Thermoflexus sp. TaxID=1969742 RepID=UPI0035E45BDE